ncbi:DUF3040 domain-containing protein [Pseudonocardia sp. KRD-184]|uniref:DUF3040 domain-containing protein n=1 Tax=Pseudonocardia oceani TaxID=2792013 RepID=A0ABS6UGG6_9PSEU|nr:DUF3040 domain-containing protein [Pseudonocardia oceani]MBW0092865.1 DUF3040 domain-containing protein [Pseudonocardia oceani]MBW0099353.1 DUF3040 domain-containing protein [Pseudonocardia oceani]MBW0112328.1 DUF3040 domain-containing protein [Pseudonocardia oceani]MBW0125479.1 DUF3040 domain-containing protein [Pseudonocardia oceani]MBW0131299.1 DUF3040 domain-containing protein [Pseudonocardia oceani]
MVNGERRLLAQIERHLAVDDPVLAESFHLWDERCGGSGGSGGRGAGSTDWLLVLTAMAVAALVLLTLVA